MTVSVYPGMGLTTDELVRLTGIKWGALGCRLSRAPALVAGKRTQMRLLTWMVVPSSLVLLLAIWRLHPSAEPEVIAEFTAVNSVLRTGDSLVAIDVDRRRITSREKEADRLGHGPIGGGGSVTIEYPFRQHQVNQVAVTFRPLSDFSIDSVAMKTSWLPTTDSSGPSPEFRSLGRRRSTADLVTKTWMFDRPVATCRLLLPRGADLQVERIVLLRSETAGRCGLYLLLAAILTPVIVLASNIVARRQRERPLRAMLFVAALTMHAILVLLLAGLGHNFDIDSWEIVANLVNDGKGIYSHTFRWPYGLPGAYLLGGVMQVHDYFRFAGQESFHLLVATILCLGNVVIAATLAVAFDFLAGLLFCLFPTAIIITGFHSQIDNVPIAVAMISWIIVLDEDRRRSFGWLCLSAILLAFSLAFKHVMIFLPLCLVFWSEFGRLRSRLAFAAAVYLMFLLHFVPVAFDHEVLKGILKNVFLYRGWYGTGLLGVCIQKVVRPAVWKFVLKFRVLDGMWLLGVFGAAFLCAKKEPRSLLFLYVTSFVVFGPALADQYLAIPLVACAWFYRYPTMCLYVGASTVWLVFSKYNIGGIADMGEFAGWYYGLPVIGTRTFPVIFLALFLGSWALRSCRGAQNGLEMRAS